MKHFGDITKLSGYNLPVVDIITGGSPCQDLSVAGKRAGLAGERSGLFMEQMRIVKEMRERDRKSGRTAWMVRPRYMVWENVDGARTSPGGNRKGADFAAVIEEIIKVAEPGASVSVCVPEGGWTKSGCYYAEDGSWSIAWRVHDAQFWGVPQRRKRISLVADFGGLSAPEILFERKGLSGDLEPRREAGQEPAGAAGGGVEGASGTISFQERGGKPGGGKGILIQHEHVGALSTLNNQSVLAYGIDQQGGKGGANYTEDVCPPILSDSHGTPHAVAYGISSYDSNAMKSPNPHSGIYAADTARTLDLNGGSPACNQGGIAVVQPCVVDTYQETAGALCAGISKQVGNQIVNQDQLITKNAIVRRLTPLECERLQGYPDGWTDIGEWVDSKGKKHKDADSPRYKALGNSIALPFWQWMARRICAQYERTVTMASLFDGIGGFPLVFQRCGAVPVWASEIEEFPIAVTKVRFPDESV